MLLMNNSSIIKSLRPMDTASYLKSHHWIHAESIGELADVWKLTSSASTDYEIVLPLDQNSSEYARRFAEVLQVLETVEDRPVTQIIHDIITTTIDTVRIRISNSDTETGTLPLQKAVKLIEEAKELMLAAACAAASPFPRSVYASRKPPEAVQYMETLQMGQTEPGSFILNIQSRVSPRLIQPSIGFESWENEPFARRTTLMLANGLHASRIAVKEALNTESLQPFEDAASLGVNANLCEALAGMAGNGENQIVDISLNWAASREVAVNTPSKFLFSSEMFPLFAEAAKQLRLQKPIPDYELVGMVTSCSRDKENEPGKVVVTVLNSSEFKRVQIELLNEDYLNAVRAHEKQEPVYCTGELVKQGKLYSLINPRDFHNMEMPNSNDLTL